MALQVVRFYAMEKFTNEHLKWHRTQLEMTREELARELKTTYTTVYRWEKGERAIPPYVELALHAVDHQLSPEKYLRRVVQVVIELARKQKIKITDEQATEIQTDAYVMSMRGKF
jgi:DNA-binding XRE family transcriptional regulator